MSQPSDYSSFWIDPLATPVITGPLGAQVNVSPDVIDVVLNWDPVAGGDSLRAPGRGTKQRLHQRRGKKTVRGCQSASWERGSHQQ